MLVKLIVVMPATNSTFEIFFILLKLIRTYLQSKMKQNRLNYLIVFSAYKNQLDRIDLIEIVPTFVDRMRTDDVHLKGSTIMDKILTLFPSFHVVFLFFRSVLLVLLYTMFVTYNHVSSNLW